MNGVITTTAAKDLADEGGPLLRLLGQEGVELLHLHQSLGEDQHLLRLLQVLHVHLQSRHGRVPHVQLVPRALSTWRVTDFSPFQLFTVCVSALVCVDDYMRTYEDSMSLCDVGKRSHCSCTLVVW